MITKLQKLLQQDSTIKAAYLFGSVAENREHMESDLDIAISAGRPLSAVEKMVLIQSIASIAGRPVDLIDLETAQGLLLRNALVDGKALIPPDAVTLERLLKRLVYGGEDLMPQVRKAKNDRVEAFAREA